MIFKNKQCIVNHIFDQNVTNKIHQNIMARQHMFPEFIQL